jgi:hypothetical protein
MEAIMAATESWFIDGMDTSKTWLACAVELHAVRG